MTRAELLAQTEAHAKAKLSRDKDRLAQVRSAQREEQRKTRDRRRFQVGKLADEAGLFAWEDDTLRQLFTLLVALTDAPDPVAVLEALLGDTDGHELTTVAGPPAEGAPHA